MQDERIPDNYRSAVRTDMLVFLPKTFERVLEIGCGEGGFRGNLPEETEYWGVEPDPVAVKKAMDVYVSDTFICGLFPQQQSKLPDDHFDVVVCNDIIEHVENTEELFYFLKKKLRSGGVLVASIPNVRHISHLKELLIKRDWEYKDSGILDRTHLRFFTKKSIINLCEQQGLELEMIEGVNGIFDGMNSLSEVLVRYFKFALPIMTFGSDTQYMQFGIRAKVSKHEKDL